MEKKSNATSIEYRTVGNKLFREGEYLFAMVAYNKVNLKIMWFIIFLHNITGSFQAICYAQTKAELALAYANRSAAFLEESKYDECLLNIQWARENGYPADKLEKLKERENKCKELKASGVTHPEQIPDGYFNLSYPPNPKIPFLAECLEMRLLPDNRRGIFTKRDLKAGDIVAVETSFINFADGPFGAVDKCYNCLKINMMNLIPCSKTGKLN